MMDDLSLKPRVAAEVIKEAEAGVIRVAVVEMGADVAAKEEVGVVEATKGAAVTWNHGRSQSPPDGIKDMNLLACPRTNANRCATSEKDTSRNDKSALLKQTNTGLLTGNTISNRRTICHCILPPIYPQWDRHHHRRRLLHQHITSELFISRTIITAAVTSTTQHSIVFLDINRVLHRLALLDSDTNCPTTFGPWWQA
jgi:hypothetical protein